MLRNITGIFRRVWVFDPTYAWGDGSKDLRQAWDRFQSSGRGIYQPGRGDVNGKLAKWSDLALRLDNCFATVDELNMAGEPPQEFHDLHRLGHKRGVGLGIGTHSIWDVPHALQQFNHLFAFRPTRIVEFNALKQVIGDQGVDWLRKAPDYWSWHVSREHQGPMPPVALPTTK